MILKKITNKESARQKYLQKCVESSIKVDNEKDTR